MNITKMIEKLDEIEKKNGNRNIPTSLLREILISGNEPYDANINLRKELDFKFKEVEKRIEDINSVANISRKSWREWIERRVAELEQRTGHQVVLGKDTWNDGKKDAPAVEHHHKECMCGLCENGVVKPSASPVACYHEWVDSKCGSWICRHCYRTEDMKEPEKPVTPSDLSKNNKQKIDFKDRSLRNIVCMIENGNMSTASASFEINNIFEIMELLRERSVPEDSIAISRKVAEKWLVNAKKAWYYPDHCMINELRKVLAREGK